MSSEVSDRLYARSNIEQRAHRHEARKRTYGVGLYFVPIVVLYTAAMLLPLLITIRNSLALGGTGWINTIQDPLFIHASVNTAVYSCVITAVTVVLAYTVAAAIWRSGRIGRIILTSLVLLSFWTSVLVKIVAWNALLRNNGIFNSFLLSIGAIDAPLRLFPGAPAVILGMIQFVLPFAVFPILGVMLRLDRKLEDAAASLGSTPYRVFRYVIFPLTLPGVIASALLVFVICTGFYVIPATLGNPSDLMIANVVALYALQLVDFHVASAVAVMLLLIVTLLTILYQRADQRL